MNILCDFFCEVTDFTHTCSKDTYHFLDEFVEGSVLYEWEALANYHPDIIIPHCMLHLLISFYESMEGRAAPQHNQSLFSFEPSIVIVSIEDLENEFLTKIKSVLWQKGTIFVKKLKSLDYDNEAIVLHHICKIIHDDFVYKLLYFFK